MTQWVRCVEKQRLNGLPPAAYIAPFAVIRTTAGFQAAYDPNGNMVLRVEVSGTQRITYTQGWDAENRLVVVTNTVSGAVTRFAYDGDGKLVRKEEVSGTTVYIGDYYEVFYPPSPPQVTKYYFLGAQRIAMRRGGVVYYLHTDHLGSTSLATDAGGARVAEQRYYPYGDTRYAISAPPTDRLYTGQRWEEGLGLYDYRARYYHPVLGRFIRADTIVPDPASPQLLNRYAYAGNNPLLYNDPDGRCGPLCVMGVATLLLGVALTVQSDVAMPQHPTTPEEEFSGRLGTALIFGDLNDAVTVLTGRDLIWGEELPYFSGEWSRTAFWVIMPIGSRGVLYLDIADKSDWPEARDDRPKMDKRSPGQWVRDPRQELAGFLQETSPQSDLQPCRQLFQYPIAIFLSSSFLSARHTLLPGGYPEEQYLFQCPDMIGDPGCHRRGALLPLFRRAVPFRRLRLRQWQTEPPVGQAKVIVALEQHRLRPQPLRRFRQGDRSSSQRRYVLAKTVVQPLNQRRIDLPAQGLQRFLHGIGATIDHSVGDGYHPSPHPLLHHLGILQPLHRHPARLGKLAPPPPTSHGHPLTEVGYQSLSIVRQLVAQKQRHASRCQRFPNGVDQPQSRLQAAVPYHHCQEQFAERVHRCPEPEAQTPSASPTADHLLSRFRRIPHLAQ